MNISPIAQLVERSPRKSGDARSNRAWGSNLKALSGVKKCAGTVAWLGTARSPHTHADVRAWLRVPDKPKPNGLRRRESRVGSGLSVPFHDCGSSAGRAWGLAIKGAQGRRFESCPQSPNQKSSSRVAFSRAATARVRHWAGPVVVNIPGITECRTGALCG